MPTPPSIEKPAIRMPLLLCDLALLSVLVGCSTDAPLRSASEADVSDRSSLAQPEVPAGEQTLDEILEEVFGLYTK